jgi:hypothetical protein
MSIFDKIIPNEVTRGFDKLGDMFMPKELAPFIGPLSMMFAGPLGMPLSLGLGQLASAKMNSGQLDPYQALGTVLSAQGYKARNPEGYGSIARGLKSGLGTFAPGGASPMDFGSKFMEGYNTPANSALSAEQKAYKNSLETREIEKETLKDTYKNELELADTKDEKIFAKEKYLEGIENLDPIKDERGFMDKVGDFSRDAGETVFPGFGSFQDTLTTIGAATTISQLMPMAEALKKQKMEDEKQEGSVWQKWFRSYKNSTGRSYGNTEYPDEAVMSKWKKYGEPLGLAMGGRVGYNEGGDTGIIAAAPGMPEGMQLDGRDGLFISQGVEEKADDVPAMLSKNEFVLTADAMKGFDKMSGGSGDPRAAAQKMYQFMDQMEAIA